jgi:hypothetical protein
MSVTVSTRAAGDGGGSKILEALFDHWCNDYEPNNNETIGWVIPVPMNADMDADIDTVEKRAAFSKLLIIELERIIRQIIHCKDDVKLKAEKCLDRIKSEHSLVDHKKKLLELYSSNF